MKHLLLVDDNISNLKMANNLLKEFYKITLTKSGSQALDFCEKQKPDLILLDIQMPEMDGFETIKHLNIGKNEFRDILCCSNTFKNSDL